MVARKVSLRRKVANKAGRATRMFKKYRKKGYTIGESLGATKNRMNW